MSPLSVPYLDNWTSVLMHLQRLNIIRGITSENVWEFINSELKVLAVDHFRTVDATFSAHSYFSSIQVHHAASHDLLAVRLQPEVEAPRPALCLRLHGGPSP